MFVCMSECMHALMNECVCMFTEINVDMHDYTRFSVSVLTVL